ncbi:hypothetical protein [uncultured Chryseobacterium sp.]|uniref:hypothetical protein n=1 Tax=uncultured Chryseobacterium sp. TaxID=259322 RepID=UPI002588CF92|nr:hypothetical protein [uncultured Chryseobacterium sp.]
MEVTEAMELISIDIFKRMVNDLEAVLSNSSKLKNEIKYHEQAVNKALQSDFEDIVNLLQTVVDKFYVDNYDISGFQYLTPADFESSLKHNLSLVQNCQKLLKFINL